MASITIVDESTMGQKRAWSLDILEEALSLRELIRRRIYQEVTEFNARQVLDFNGLVQPSDAERSLNGYRLKKAQKLNWETQYKRALEAFKGHGIIVLVDDKQVDDLDAIITLHAGSEITFFKLVPLVGG
ncbi:hypothetical protein [Ktedonospora formicarum]|uniref:Uncharacterized protein n=1 Tax=Ktedonospora formicarum TaxID=2778364 RepID=A0A8J3MYA3_9CHLR|nr:hypothetical protein [Ktedonospora formicarum]GHO49445.1 hypothetical protein KSX_76080 [Ktedonospora formicarum]